MTSFAHAVTIDDVRAARERIDGHVLRTPVARSERIDDWLGTSLFFKCENLQHIGAFKARGACNAVLSLSDKAAAAGVATHSSGNHAAALARAARRRGIAAHIVMPHNSRANKIDAVRRFGVEPVFCEPTAESRQATADRVVAETGVTFVHPYDDPRIIAGQGTVGLELLEQLDEIDVVVVPVGGGGLLSGCLVAIKSQRPNVEVIAAEPSWADDAHRSLESGRIEMPTRYDTIADGLRTPLGRHTFPIIRDLVDDVLLASESGIIDATWRLWSDAKLVVEPSGATPLACIAEHPDRFHDRKVAVVISGGNIDVGNLPARPEPASEA